jgi:hypothetical protein
MKISGSPPLPPPAVNHARTSSRGDATAPAESGKTHGLVRAAAHSHRSDVAALRQWINHPDLRSELSLPDLTTEHNGRGFEKAVAAYEAATATAIPPPVDEA